MANIQLQDKIVQEEARLKNKAESEEYFNNFIEYWSKVWKCYR